MEEPESSLRVLAPSLAQVLNWSNLPRSKEEAAQSLTALVPNWNNLHRSMGELGQSLRVPVRSSSRSLRSMELSLVVVVPSYKPARYWSTTLRSRELSWMLVVRNLSTIRRSRVLCSMPVRRSWGPGRS